MKTLLALVILLSVSLNCRAASHDGVWWRQLSPLEKAVFTAGMAEGAYVGCLAIGSKSPAGSDALTQTLDRFIGGTNIEQIENGVDRFFGDFRNRQIPACAAFYFVVLQINGAEAQEINDQVLRMRRAAARNR